MPFSINFSMTLQTEILSKVISDFLKQAIILKSFNFVSFVPVFMKNCKYWQIDKYELFKPCDTG